MLKIDKRPEGEVRIRWISINNRSILIKVEEGAKSDLMGGIWMIRGRRIMVFVLERVFTKRSLCVGNNEHFQPCRKKGFHNQDLCSGNGVCRTHFRPWKKKDLHKQVLCSGNVEYFQPWEKGFHNQALSLCSGNVDSFQHWEKGFHNQFLLFSGSVDSLQPWDKGFYNRVILLCSGNGELGDKYLQYPCQGLFLQTQKDLGDQRSW